MSVSVSFGSAPSTFDRHDRQRIPSQKRGSGSETYLPQTLVLGMFLIIFGAQIAVNMAQVRRVQRRRLGERDRNRTIVVNAPPQEAETVMGEQRDEGEGVVRDETREQVPAEERLQTRDAG